jgi:hypothetical protein
MSFGQYSSEPKSEQKSLRDIAREIVATMGPEWKLSTRFDEEDAHDIKPWRSRIEGPNQQAVFLSNTWGPKGMLHAAGWAPDGVSTDTRDVGPCPNINMSLNKTAEQMAKDITRRLLPEYQIWLAKVLERDVKEKAYKNSKAELKRAVAELFGTNPPRDDYETVRSHGAIDVEVSGPDSMRLHGHCMYITLDQLRRFKAAVPELFQREKD